MTWTTRPRSKTPNGLAYWQEGNGPALILVHGVGLRAEAWAAMMPLLRAHFSVYAIDLPGHGETDLGSVSSLSDYQCLILELVHDLDGPVYIAGHSLGAIIALGVAFEGSDEIDGVAALNAIYRRDDDAAKAVLERARVLRSGCKSDPGPTLERWFGNAPTGSLAEARDACRQWLLDANLDGYATAYSLFARQDGPDDSDLQSLTVPALFQTGRHDPNSTPEMSKAMAEHTPKGQASDLDAAHMMPMTHPNEVASTIVEMFVS